MTEQTTETDTVTPDESGRWPEPADVPVHVAWANVMRDVGVIRKRDRNQSQNFNFRGVDAVVNVVGPVCRKHGVFVLPYEVREVREDRYLSKNDAAMHAVLATFVWRIYGPQGDFLHMESIGESADAGDKASPKAHSVAYRTALLESLMIPTDEIDPDAESHERATHREPSADPNDRDEYGRTSKEAQEYTVAVRKLLDAAKEWKLTPQAVEASFDKKEGRSVRGKPVRDESGAVTGCDVTAEHVDAFRGWLAAQVTGAADEQALTTAEEGGRS